MKRLPASAARRVVTLLLETLYKAAYWSHSPAGSRMLPDTPLDGLMFAGRWRHRV